MKYLMGLIITFALESSVFAQDYSKSNSNQKSDNARKQNESSAKFRQRESDFPMGSSGDAKEDSLIRFNNGSAEYSNAPTLRPGVKEDMNSNNNNSSSVKSKPESNSGMNEEYITPSDESMQGKESGMIDDNSILSNQCALFNELETRSGAFRDKRKLGDGNLLIKREKDGGERIKFNSNKEFYDFQRKAKGKEQYSYGIMNDNAMVQLDKNPDGSVSVYYEGVFPSAEEAENAITNGFNLNNFGNVCNTNFSDIVNEASADNK